jgi:biotin operon repressor
VTKTERWYAVVEELRAVSPRPRSAQWLADRFEVSRRTIERDLDGLLQAGVPLYAKAGRAGGWILDRSATLGTPVDVLAEIAPPRGIDLSTVGGDHAMDLLDPAGNSDSTVSRSGAKIGCTSTS